MVNSLSTWTWNLHGASLCLPGSSSRVRQLMFECCSSCRYALALWPDYLARQVAGTDGAFMLNSLALAIADPRCVQLCPAGLLDYSLSPHAAAYAGFEWLLSSVQFNKKICTCNATAYRKTSSRRLNLYSIQVNEWWMLLTDSCRRYGTTLLYWCCPWCGYWVVVRTVLFIRGT